MTPQLPSSHSGGNVGRLNGRSFPIVSEEHHKLLDYLFDTRGSALPMFEVTQGLFDSVSKAELIATLMGLAEAGLLNLPYPEITVRCPPRIVEDGTQCITLEGIATGIYWQDGDIILRTSDCLFVSINDGTRHLVNTKRLTMISMDTGEFTDAINPKFGAWTNQLFLYTAGLLVASLASRNVVKRTTVNKRVANGKPSKSIFRGPSNTIYVSRTVVEPPQQCAIDNEHPGDGIHVSPHLRRGFVNTFHVGPGRTETMKKWIEPVFVNADKNFVAKLPRYQVTT